MGRLENKIAIVTGTGGGFGRSRIFHFWSSDAWLPRTKSIERFSNPVTRNQIAKRLTSEGAKVLGIDLHSASNEKTTDICPLDTYVAYNADITSIKSWDEALKLVQSRFGAPPTIVINCAGVVHLGQDPHLVPEEDFDRVFQINVKPIYLSTKVIVPFWIENNIHGHFINIGSIGQLRPRPSTVWYASSKGAVLVATEGLAAAYAKNQIRFNVIRPSIAETAMLPIVQGGQDTPEGRAKRIATLPLGRLCQPEDVANMACFLASDEANYITGSAFNVDGGRCVS